MIRDSGVNSKKKKKKNHTKEVRVQFYLGTSMGTIARETDSQL